jgi:hypothetical protein
MLDDHARPTATQAYDGGVAMGGDLVGTGEAPAFIAWAQRDAEFMAARCNACRWSRSPADGEDRSIDAACHGGTPDPMPPPLRRQWRQRVDMSTCTTRRRQAPAELKVLWTDPDFDPASGRPIMSACWKTRPAAGRHGKPCAMAPRRVRMCRRRFRNAPIPRRSGIFPAADATGRQFDRQDRTGAPLACTAA